MSGYGPKGNASGAAPLGQAVGTTVMVTVP